MAVGTGTNIRIILVAAVILWQQALSIAQDQKIHLLELIAAEEIAPSAQKYVKEAIAAFDPSALVSFHQGFVKLKFTSEPDPDQVLEALNSLGIGMFEFVQRP